MLKHRLLTSWDAAASRGSKKSRPDIMRQRDLPNSSSCSTLTNRGRTLSFCQHDRHCLGSTRLHNGCLGQGWVVDQHLFQIG
jgi:hypothetical protein